MVLGRIFSGKSKQQQSEPQETNKENVPEVAPQLPASEQTGSAAPAEGDSTTPASEEPTAEETSKTGLKEGKKQNNRRASWFGSLKLPKPQDHADAPSVEAAPAEEAQASAEHANKAKKRPTFFGGMSPSRPSPDADAPPKTGAEIVAEPGSDLEKARRELKEADEQEANAKDVFAKAKLATKAASNRVSALEKAKLIELKAEHSKKKADRAQKLKDETQAAREKKDQLPAEPPTEATGEESSTPSHPAVEPAGETTADKSADPAVADAPAASEGEEKKEAQPAA